MLHTDRTDHNRFAEQFSQRLVAATAMAPTLHLNPAASAASVAPQPQGQNTMPKKRNQKGQFVPGWSAGMDKARIDAKAQGLKRYLGKPCPHGHPGERYTRSNICCECKRLDFAAYIDANRESYNSYARRYYHALPAEKLAAVRKKFAESRKAYEAANPEKTLANKKQYFRDNPERWRAYVRNRRARLANVQGIHSPADIKKIRTKQSGKCALCRIALRGKGEVDHIRAVSRGGTNWPTNLQLLCRPCNRTKHAKDPIDHARSLGLLL